VSVACRQGATQEGGTRDRGAREQVGEDRLPAGDDRRPTWQRSPDGWRWLPPCPWAPPPNLATTAMPSRGGARHLFRGRGASTAPRRWRNV